MLRQTSQISQKFQRPVCPQFLLQSQTVSYKNRYQYFPEREAEWVNNERKAEW